jgi:hypothetical protein
VVEPPDVELEVELVPVAKAATEMNERTAAAIRLRFIMISHRTRVVIPLHRRGYVAGTARKFLD